MQFSGVQFGMFFEAPVDSLFRDGLTPWAFLFCARVFEEAKDCFGEDITLLSGAEIKA
jgi:hypothetical protein